MTTYLNQLLALKNAVYKHSPSFFTRVIFNLEKENQECNFITLNLLVKLIYSVIQKVTNKFQFNYLKTIDNSSIRFLYKHTERHKFFLLQK